MPKLDPELKLLRALYRAVARDGAVDSHAWREQQAWLVRKRSARGDVYLPPKSVERFERLCGRIADAVERYEAFLEEEEPQ